MTLIDSRCLNNLVVIVLASHVKALGTSCVLPNWQSYLLERVIKNSSKFGRKLISEDPHGADSQNSGVKQQ